MKRDLKSRHILPINDKMDVEKLILTCLLATIPLGVLESSDFYLPQVGPAPLRFAAAPAVKPFVWPVALKFHSPTNNIPAITNYVSTVNTDVVLTASSPPLQTNDTVDPSPGLNVLVSMPTPQLHPPTDGNMLSASNLLVLTPQMLADYLKMNLDNLSAQSTNRPAGPEVPFVPPSPTPPSSEAIYRSQ